MLKPQGNRVVIKIGNEEEKTESGIIIASTGAESRPKVGEVVAIGKGRILESGDVIPIDLKVGDSVMYVPGGSSEIRYENQDYLVLDYQDVLVVL